MYRKFYYLTVSLISFIVIIPVIGIISNFEFEFSNLYFFFNNNYNIKIIYITFIQAFLSAFLSCLIAIPFSLSLYRHRNLKLIKFIISLCGYSFVLPPILIVYSVIGIYGINGALNNLINYYDLLNLHSIFGLKAILIAHILLNAPFATRLMFQNLNTIPKNYFEISNSLNLGFWSSIIKLEWPILKQNILAIFSIIFVLCFLSFAIVMALGGGPSTSTIEVAIYQSALFELNFQKAIILSFIQIIICLVFLILGFYKLKGSNFFLTQTDYFYHPFKNYLNIKLFDYCLIILLSIILFSPIYYIISNFLFNLFNQNFFKEYLIKAFINSVILSFFTGFSVTFLGLIVSLLLVQIRNKVFLQQALFLISSIILVISPVIISLGYFIILGELRYNLLITYIVIIVINFIFLLPFSILILFTKLKNIFINFEDIKKAFRINDKNYIRIIYPLIKKNIIYIFSFSVVLSFGDFTIITFFKNESFQTLPSILYKLIVSYRFEEASFVSGFILIFSLSIYLLFDNNFYRDSPDNNM